MHETKATKPHYGTKRGVAPLFHAASLEKYRTVMAFARTGVQDGEGVPQQRSSRRPGVGNVTRKAGRVVRLISPGFWTRPTTELLICRNSPEGGIHVE